MAWEAFLGAVATSASDDVVPLVHRVEHSKAFRIEQANDQRALYVRFAHNRKKSLQTEEGRTFLRRMLPRLAGINEYSTVSALSAFGNIDEMESSYHVQLVEILVELMRSIDPRKTPSVYNTTRRLLLGAPSAVRRYRREHGDPVRELD